MLKHLLSCLNFQCLCRFGIGYFVVVILHAEHRKSDDLLWLLNRIYTIAHLWRLYWDIINPENTYVPTPEQMKEYDIPEDMEWGKIW